MRFVIEQLRRKKYWSRRRLAREAGLNINTLWELETGKTDLPRPETMEKIARALGVEVENLTVEDDAPLAKTA